ncbi:hypothetical protein [Oceanobacillus damuensis]|uniref:hypothetical protein n=1 Tax=Oceanobacillus damuensis TaxID=937928 RepID=UPI000833A870|nr:hypothetical protein [Oceanobacillus damuensis]
MELGEKESVVTATSTINEVDDFLLHVRVEEADKGIQVQSSLQYIGEEQLLIRHQAPLVSVSYNENIHDFTGDFISQELERGDIYNAQYSVLPYPESKDSNIYIHARFRSNGQQINIVHVEQLIYE